MTRISIFILIASMLIGLLVGMWMAEDNPPRKHPDQQPPPPNQVTTDLLELPVE